MNPRSLPLSRLLVLLALIFVFVQITFAGQFIVTNTNDAGAGSLRQAMLDADAAAGSDTILFNIPAGDPGHNAGAGIWTIQPLTPLPNINSDSTMVDGLSQAQFIGGDPNPLGPEIVLDGVNTETSSLRFFSSYNTVRNLVIHRFNTGQIVLNGSFNRIIGCYLGCDHTGQVAMGGDQGIFIGGDEGNIIGGMNESERNIISGNTTDGVRLVSSHRNEVLNNYIGISRDGTSILGNGADGIEAAHTEENIFGPGNVISGNGADGINLSGRSYYNRIIGNVIGTNPDGSTDWGNGKNGIGFYNGPSNNTIGGPNASDRNLISGNQQSGVNISGDETNLNKVQGNLIGTDMNGLVAISNQHSGLSLFAGPRENTIGGETTGEGNIISGNLQSGIWIWGESTSLNHISGNKIGTDATGNAPIPNEQYGIDITNNAPGNNIGPNNIVAYNQSHGVQVNGTGAIGNTITQNSIFQNGQLGIDTNNGGNLELAPPEITLINSVSGVAPANAVVEIFSGPDNEGKTYLGQTTADAAGDFMWPGTPDGPWVTATATDGDGNTSEFSAPVHMGNFTVTTTADAGEGSLRWAIEGINESAGPDTIDFNIPESDEGFDGTTWNIRVLTRLPDIVDGGTQIDGSSQTQNQSDTNADGPEIVISGSDMSESSDGIIIKSPGNTILELIISGFSWTGLKIDGDEAVGNIIQGCYIGTDVSATNAQSNNEGIYIGTGSQYNQIGGAEPSQRNIISGNRTNGVYIADANNVIIGNFIGVDRTGTQELGNETNGIVITRSSLNRIGGTLSGEGNVIAGNGQDGIVIISEYADENVVLGNKIGTDITGTQVIPNEGEGIELSNGASKNVIGGLGEGEPNIISGNGGDGIQLHEAGTDSNQVLGNFIGTAGDGDTPLPNGRHGIHIYRDCQYTQIGPDNVIRFNEDNGILVSGSASFYNTITLNIISGNAEEGIRLSGGANQNITPPQITGIGSLVGTAPPNSRVEIYSDPGDEGLTFEGITESDEDGNFYFPDMPAGPHITATATDAAGNTSEFSSPLHFGNFIVTSTADQGEGTLRWAIERANENFGADTIEFQIPQSDENFDGTTGTWKILPMTELPWITDGDLVIDGFSQQAFVGLDINPDGPEIWIAGETIGSRDDGFFINADNVHIIGLTISGFGNWAIRTYGVQYGSVRGCYIGTDPTGTLRRENRYGIGLTYGTRAFQVAPLDTLPNLVSGNRHVGIAVDDSSNSNLIWGNIIGLNRSMTDTLSNGNYGGIRLFERSDSNQVAANVISGNHWGIYVYESSANTITDNFIGTDSLWQNDFGNENEGIYITADDDSATDNIILDNVIGYNGTYGVRVRGQMVIRNLISGNEIAENEWAGIEISNGGNMEISPPTIVSVTETQVTGTSDPVRLIEIFADENGQGRYFLGATTADESGTFVFDFDGSPPLTHITATAIDGDGNTSEFSEDVIVSIKESTASVTPQQFRLYQNTPNPFNPETNICFSVAEPCRVQLKIFNIRGQEVATLLDEKRQPGTYETKFHSNYLSSGMYFYRIQMKDFVAVKKMLLLE